MKRNYEAEIFDKKNGFRFIDTMRFIAMAAIVYEHTSLLWEYFELKSGVLNNNESFILCSYINIAKFGTIVFFIISGFLMNSKKAEYNAKEYFRNRVNSIIKPWLIFSFVFFILIFLKDFIKFKIGRGNIKFKDLPTFCLEKITETAFFSSYWFVLNLLICFLVLFMFQKHVRHVLTGICLGVFTLLYSANIYFNRIPTEHTTALFGFVFFLWLGMIINQNYQSFKNAVNKTPFLYFIVLFALTFFFSVIESVYLIQIGSYDPFNTLRISNIFFSLSAFLFLFKTGNIRVINNLNPRESTFGIYLTHMIMVLILIPLIFGPFNANGGAPILEMSLSLLICLSLLRFIIIYFASYLFVKFIAGTKLRWILGLKNSDQPEISTPLTAESTPHFAAVPVPADLQRTLLPD